MTEDRKVEEKDAEVQRASRYRDELEPPPTAPGQPQQTQGIAPGSSKVGEDVERPQYGNVIRRSLDHDEGKDDTDAQSGADESVASDEDVNSADVDGLSDAHVQRIREKGF